MQIEPLGLLAVALGLLGWFLKPAFSIHVFIISTLLGAAAAAILTGFGSANIPPAHLLFGLLLVASLTRRDLSAAAIAGLSFPRAGFWLLLTAIYGVVSAMFFPHLFSGATYVFAIARTEIGPGIVLTPLTETSGNVTQTIYFIADVFCFLLFYAYGSRPAELKVIAQAIIACAAVNLAFAALDLITFWTNTADLLGFVRNASYRMLDDVEVNGVKRIVGSFAEASAFAYGTLGLFAFCTKLWLSGVYPRVTGSLASASLCALLFATSSAGYAGTAGFLIALYVTSAARAMVRPVPRATMAFVLGMPALALVVVVGVRLDDSAWATVDGLVNKTIVNKLSSDSGVERTAWNEQAMKNFAETDGLGAGIGSVRTSSFPLAILGNIGVPGAITYGAFLFGVLLRRKDRWPEPFPAACQSAARWACFAQLVSATVAGSFIDLGLPFFVFAGLACARPGLRDRRVPRPAGAVIGRRPLAPA
jgi:hypothetical protein